MCKYGSINEKKQLDEIILNFLHKNERKFNNNFLVNEIFFQFYTQTQ